MSPTGLGVKVKRLHPKQQQEGTVRSRLTWLWDGAWPLRLEWQEAALGARVLSSSEVSTAARYREGSCSLPMALVPLE